MDGKPTDSLLDQRQIVTDSFNGPGFGIDEPGFSLDDAFSAKPHLAVRRIVDDERAVVVLNVQRTEAIRKVLQFAGLFVITQANDPDALEAGQSNFTARGGAALHRNEIAATDQDRHAIAGTHADGLSMYFNLVEGLNGEPGMREVWLSLMGVEFQHRQPSILVYARQGAAAAPE